MNLPRKKISNPFEGMGFDEALRRLVQTDKGEIADAIAEEMMEHVTKTKESINSARKEIERGARTRQKKDRFRI